MAENRLIEALHDCMERMANGESLDEVIQRYPDDAEALRLLLIVGQLPTQARATSDEVRAARVVIRSRLGTALAELNEQDSGPRLSGGRWLSLLVALLTFGVLIVGLMFLQRRPDPNPSIEKPIVTATPTPSPTITRSPTPTLTATIMPTETATATPTSDEEDDDADNIADDAELGSDNSEAACEPERPDGWVIYRIQAGDTLSSIAVATGANLDDLQRVNCIDDPRLIVVGVQIFVPRALQDSGIPIVPTNGQPSNDGQAPPNNEAPPANNDNQEDDQQGSDPPDDNDDDDDGVEEDEEDEDDEDD